MATGGQQPTQRAATLASLFPWPVWRSMVHAIGVPLVFTKVGGGCSPVTRATICGRRLLKALDSFGCSARILPKPAAASDGHGRLANAG